MELKINKIVLENFKGVRHREYLFEGQNVKVCGVNSSGKTTLADAWYFLWADCNTALVKNPPITPLGLPEVISRVEIELLLDGKPLTVAKTQKFRSKEVDGKVTSSITNGYEINSIEKSNRDFVKDLESRGIDIEHFLIFSHPAAFTSDPSKQGREKMRSFLFKMCEGVVDTDLAADVPDIDDLKKLLLTYSLEEVEQMNKSTIKKINEVTGGPSNNIINARIDELLSQKTNADESVLNEQKKSYEAEIERCDKELADISGGKVEIQKQISELRIKAEEIKNEATLQLNRDRNELEKNIREFTAIIDENNFRLSRTKSDIARNETLLSEAKQDIENQRIKYKVEQDSVIDEGDLSCPVCHRTYDAEKLASIKAEFEKNKAEKLKSIKSMGDDLKSKIEGYEADLNRFEKDKNNIERLIDETQKMRDDVQKRLDEMPTSATYEMPTNSEYVEITGKMLALETELMKSDDSRKEKIEESKAVAKEMLNNVIKELGKVEKNKEIDERVEKLREERREAEINRAYSEKVIDQVERFKKAKNDLLSEKINSHFKIAQFRLFKTLKNGSVEDACDVLIDGKEINTQVNQASQILAKLDIIRGLSDYFETRLPVFIDDFALFTEESEKKIVMDNQLIKLVATDEAEELTIRYEQR